MTKLCRRGCQPSFPHQHSFPSIHPPTPLPATIQTRASWCVTVMNTAVKEVQFHASAAPPVPHPTSVIFSNLPGEQLAFRARAVSPYYWLCGQIIRVLSIKHTYVYRYGGEIDIGSSRKYCPVTVARVEDRWGGMIVPPFTKNKVKLWN